MSASNKARKVLVIEDNRDFAYLLCSALIQMGYEVDSTNNGSAGIERAKSLLPDIIICDIGLPEANGYEVAQAVRQDASLKDVYMIALTGYASPREIDLAKESGFNVHLSKPVSFVGLVKILDEALGLEPSTH